MFEDYYMSTFETIKAKDVPKTYDQIYMEVPGGLETELRIALQLKISLCSVTQSPKYWNTKFDKSLFNVHKIDNNLMFLIIYIADKLTAEDIKIVYAKENYIL